MPALAETVRDLSAIHNIRAELVQADFVEWAADRVCGFGAMNAPQFDIVLMNPPYHKIGTSSPHRQRLLAAGVAVPNIYAGFVALAARLLVGFKQFLRATPEPGTVPLIYPKHVRGRTVTWPQLTGRKANAFLRTAESAKWLMPAGVYVVVKRFSAKEEPRRVVATVVGPDDLPGGDYAFENHLNVFHSGGRGLDAELAHGASRSA